MSNDAYNSILQLVSVRQSLTTGSASNGFLGFSTIDDSNAQGVRDAGRIAIVNEAGTSRNSATALGFWTNAGGTNTTAATEKMRITSAGNVGIGTTSPTAPLVFGKAVYGSTASEDFFRIKIQDLGGIQNDVGIGQPATQCLGFNVGVAGYISFNEGTNGERVRIANGGNVGIGTTAPVGSLNISKNSTVDGLSQAITISSSSVPTQRMNLGYVPASNYSFIDTINYGINNTNQALSLQPSGGNVGIGTTSPGTKLDVSGIARATSLSTVSGLGLQVGGYAFLSQTTSGVMTFLGHNIRASDSVANTAIVQNAGWISSLMKMYYSDGITFHTDSTVYAAGATYPLSTTERMRITPAGNVGIGTTSPGASIHVAGAINSTPTGDGFLAGIQSGYAVIHLNGSAATGSLIDFSVSGTDTKGRILYDNTNNYFGFNTNGSERLRITSTGDVGIGTTSPTAKLHVIGNATVSATLLTANIKLTGTLTDSLNQVGTAGQVLSSTGTGTEWVTGGGGGGTTITVKEEGTTVSSSISTLNFVGSNVNATASGSTATISVRDNVGTGSQYLNDLSIPYAIPGSYTDTVNINGTDIIVVAPNASKPTETLIAVLTFGISNITGSDRFNSFYFRLYNNTTSSVISDTEHRWSSYMSVDDPTTIATFHIPIKLTEIYQGDDIYVQCKTSVVDAPEIYYCALTFIKGTE